MKVCIIIPKLLPIPCVRGGAIEKLVNDLIDENEKKQKLDITLVSIYDGQAEEESKRYKHTKFIYIKNDFKYKIKAIWVRLRNLIGRNLNTYNERALDEIKNKEFDYIVVEDGAYKSFKSYLKYFDKNQMILHFHHNGESDKITDETFSTYVGVSNYVANTFKNSSTIKDIVVLKNGLQMKVFDKDIDLKEKEQIREKVGLGNEDFVIIFCGRLIREKGVMELVKAIKSIENPNIKLMIVGSINFADLGTSDYLEELDNEIKSSNGKVVSTGYLDNKELYKYYKSSDLGIVPSIWEEAAGLVVIEIMMNKLPLIVTRVGGVLEYASKESIIIEKDDNLIKSLKREIISLYNDKEKRKNMAEIGYEHAKDFTTEKFYSDFVNILNKKDERQNE